eukprot:CAMPEP_0168754228 /NCGR_PEP_ID=MMETSP0724-20121128/19386_1 /TAXON_ID=265536 /ORGANISM="Amphiprora sp., Strain CCMP467" /LENGTH=168 /DNA_ID=CAMNT_0008802687 /DNA_START=662 /DNA_END=1169 /DNA_ORIENTATION=+
MPVIKKKQAVFDVAIEEKHGVSLTTPKSRRKDKSKTEETEAMDEDGGEEEDGPDVSLPVPDEEEAVDAIGKYINLQPANDKLINSEIILAHNVTEIQRESFFHGGHPYHGVQGCCNSGLFRIVIQDEEVEATDEDGGEKMMAVDANGKYINLQPAYAKLINAAILCDK